MARDLKGSIAFAVWRVCLRVKLYRISGWLFRSSWWPVPPNAEPPPGLMFTGTLWTPAGPVPTFGRSVPCRQCGNQIIVSPPPDEPYLCCACDLAFGEGDTE